MRTTIANINMLWVRDVNGGTTNIDKGVASDL